MSEKSEFVFAGAPYSNSAPLVDYLTEVDSRVRVINDVPVNLVNDLKSGRADVALIPVAHLFEHPELKMVDGLGVAADGPVRSVLLKCNKKMGQIKTVARDPASASSNALAELLLTKYFKQKVEMVDSDAVDSPDARVAIGDRALCSEPSPCGDIDLASAWQKWTQLPFVFAVWAVRADFAEVDAVAQIAQQAYASGWKNMEFIARRFSEESGRDMLFWLHYLDGSIHYLLSADDLAGMKRFRKFLQRG